MKNRTRKSAIALVLAFSMLLLQIPMATKAAEEIAQHTEAPTLSAEAIQETSAALKADPLQLAEGSSILKYVDTEVFRKGDHIARLREDETLSSYVFLNNDGTRTVYYMDEEVKFVDANGSIQEKDLTLTSTVGGYTTASNDVLLTLPNNPASGIGLTYGNYHVSLIPRGGTLSKPLVLEDNTVTYPDYFGQGMDLVYTPTISGVKEDIVLDAYTGVNSFTFMLNTRGLNLYQANGRYFLSPAKGSDLRIDLGDIVSFDAKGRFSIGTVTATTVTAGSLYRLTITVDEEFLTDENTAYPVSIDPTLTVSDNTHGAGAIRDATIYQGAPSLNTGSWTYLHCGYYDSTYQVARTAFQLPALMNSAAISDDNLLSAVFYIKEATGSAGIPVNLYAINSSWTESNITWNSHSNSFAYYAEASASPSYNNYASYDITEFVRERLTGEIDDYGFMLVSTNETAVDKAFLSSESGASTRPYVIATYASDCNPFYSDYSSANYYRNPLTSFDPELYLDHNLQLRANCYGYAFRFTYGERTLPSHYETELGNTIRYYKQMPGEFANKANGLTIKDTYGETVQTIFTYDQLGGFYTQHIYNSASTVSNAIRADYIEQLMQADARALGYRITEYTGTTIPNAENNRTRRMVALVVAQGVFHFYMQHSDNTWSHKEGSTQPTNQCLGEEQHYLTNGNIMECAKTGDYANGELRFYYITKNAVIDYMHYDGCYECPQTEILVTDYAGNCKEAAKDIGTVPVTGISGAYDYINDVDYYQFRTNTSGQYTFNASTPNASYPLIAVLYDDLGNVIHQAQSTSGSVSFTYTLSGSSQYFVSFSSTINNLHGFGRNYLFSISSS